MKNINIDGAKLKALLIEKTGKTLAEISTENNYSDRFLAIACARNVASPNVVIVAKHYGIEPAEYELKPEAKETDGGQMTLDDLEVIRRSELKDIVKEAIAELFNNYAWACIQDPIRQETRFYLRKKEEG